MTGSIDRLTVGEPDRLTIRGPGVRTVIVMTTITAPADRTSSTRLHGLDALRGGALLLGIVLHSLMPFIPGMPWLVNDQDRSVGALGGMYVIHLFRMPLFLLLAGYFARMSLHRKGTGAFVKDRLKRIGLPLVAFWPIAAMPLILLAGLNAYLREVPEVQAPPEAGNGLLLLFGPAHMWFLQVLLECYLIMIVGRLLARRVLGEQRCTAIADRVGRVLSGPAGLPLAMLPYAAAVILQGEPVTGGIQGPMTIIPEPRGLLAFFGAFVAGWALHARRDALHRLTRSCWAYLAIAVVATVAGLPLTDAGAPIAVVAVVVAVAGWAWIFALLGLVVRYLNKDRPAVRYLADASYWMYLLHLPLLVALEIPLADLDLPIIVKLLITWAASLVILILSYHLLVRSTWIGRWLNGRKHQWTWPPFAAASAPAEKSHSRHTR